MRVTRYGSKRMEYFGGTRAVWLQPWPISNTPLIIKSITETLQSERCLSALRDDLIPGLDEHREAI